eukprot:m.238985 g.238985  ORF g.238985 m.238985 type:complete len:435 (+) comp17118_c1_seq2:126-1430(+)
MHYHNIGRLFAPLSREIPKDTVARSHQLLLQAGYVWQVSSGIYSLLPLATRVLQRVKTLVRDELNKIGSQECILPAITDKALWDQSGRWQAAGDELFRFHDRKGAQYCLAATHEETVTALVAAHVTSYRSLPLYLYQMQPKYRDELRPRYGLLRCREFFMKDMYTFDCTEEDAVITYNKVVESYKAILQALDIPYVVVEADTGLIGGTKSHEFQIQADIGEDTIVACSTCNKSANVERTDALATSCPHGQGIKLDAGPLPSSQCNWTHTKGIEVGHAFLLGTKYSEVFNAKFSDHAGSVQTIHMGCYGLGLTRILTAVAEARHDEEGFRWPMAMAPFKVSILSAGNMSAFKDEKCRALYDILNSHPTLADLVTLDTRDMSAKHKLADSRLIGIPYTILVGDRFDSNHLEVFPRSSKDPQRLSVEEFLQLASTTP